MRAARPVMCAGSARIGASDRGLRTLKQRPFGLQRATSRAGRGKQARNRAWAGGGELFQAENSNLCYAPSASTGDVLTKFCSEEQWTSAKVEY